MSYTPIYIIKKDEYMEQRKWGDDFNKNQAPQRDLGVLLIDMQPLFLSRIGSRKLDSMLVHQKWVLGYCQKHDVPVFILEYRSYGATIQELSNEAEKLKRYKYITKGNDDGFDHTSLAELLSAEKVKKVLLMGVTATHCVMSTASGAINRGFSIMTSEKLIANFYDREDDERREYLEWGTKKDPYSGGFK